MKNYLLILILFKTLTSLSQKVSIPKKPDIVTFSHLIEIKIQQDGRSKYFDKAASNLLLSDNKYIVNIDYLNTNTDIINSYIRTGIKEFGLFNKGYKNKLWKITYKGKIVKTENWNNGLIKGFYKVYNTKGKLLYETNFGVEGNGKYKDFYYKTDVLKQEGNYHKGKKEGEWCNYDTKGKLSKAVFYEQGILIEN